MSITVAYTKDVSISFANSTTPELIVRSGGVIRGRFSITPLNLSQTIPLAIPSTLQIVAGGGAFLLSPQIPVVPNRLYFAFFDFDRSPSTIFFTRPVPVSRDQIVLFSNPGVCRVTDARVNFFTLQGIPVRTQNIRFDADGLAATTVPITIQTIFNITATSGFPSGTTSTTRQIVPGAGYVLDCTFSTGARTLTLTPAIPSPEGGDAVDDERNNVAQIVIVKRRRCEGGN